MLPDIRLFKKPKSKPRLRVMVVSHFRPGLESVEPCSSIELNFSSKYGPFEVAAAMEYVVYINPDPIRLLPAVPYERRSFKLDNQSLLPSMKSSSIIRHATAADGKYPQRLPLANFAEPSARIVTVSKYLSIIV